MDGSYDECGFCHYHIFQYEDIIFSCNKDLQDDGEISICPCGMLFSEGCGEIRDYYRTSNMIVFKKFNYDGKEYKNVKSV